jgi:hypothetical protein
LKINDFVQRSFHDTQSDILNITSRHRFLLSRNSYGEPNRRSQQHRPILLGIVEQVLARPDIIEGYGSWAVVATDISRALAKLLKHSYGWGAYSGISAGGGDIAQATVGGGHWVGEHGKSKLEHRRSDGVNKVVCFNGVHFVKYRVLNKPKQVKNPTAEDLSKSRRVIWWTFKKRPKDAIGATKYDDSSITSLDTIILSNTDGEHYEVDYEIWGTFKDPFQSLSQSTFWAPPAAQQVSSHTRTS